MKRKNLKVGMTVCLGSRDNLLQGHCLTEAVVIDTTPWQWRGYYPRKPERTGGGQGVAVAKRYSSGSDHYWYPDVVSLNRILGPADEIFPKLELNKKTRMAKNREKEKLIAEKDDRAHQIEEAMQQCLWMMQQQEQLVRRGNQVLVLMDDLARLIRLIDPAVEI
jgi:hypothetical protein